jgi:hypothetical protein
MVNPDASHLTAERIADMEHQLACSLSKFAFDMTYVDDLDTEDRSEVYAILQALEDDAKVTREQMAILLGSLTEAEVVNA